MTSSARDKIYGRRGGRWAEPPPDEDAYQAGVEAKRKADEARAQAEAQGDLFADTEDGDQ